MLLLLGNVAVMGIQQLGMKRQEKRSLVEPTSTATPGMDNLVNAIDMIAMRIAARENCTRQGQYKTTKECMKNAYRMRWPKMQFKD